MKYLTQGQIQVIVFANKPLEVNIKTTNKFYTHNCSLLLPYQHEGSLLLLPTKENCLLDYDQVNSLQFLHDHLAMLIEIAGQHAIADIILEKHNERYSIIGLSYPASITYINKDFDKQTTSLQEKPEFQYDGKGGYHFNWCFGMFPDDADIIDTY